MHCRLVGGGPGWRAALPALLAARTPRWRQCKEGRGANVVLWGTRSLHIAPVRKP